MINARCAYRLYGLHLISGWVASENTRYLLKSLIHLRRCPVYLRHLRHSRPSAACSLDSAVDMDGRKKI
jgi:hypothetical protein